MMRRSRGFTLVELLVSLFAMALLAGLSWRGLDGMMRAREITERRADEVLALQTGLAQWMADLDAIEQYPPAKALDWNGRVLRLTRRGSLSPTDGVRVVGWARREGRWVRWESPPVLSRGDLDAAWLQADLWAQNPNETMRAREVTIAPLRDWQIFFYRGNSWTNPLSSGSEGEGGPDQTGVIRGATPPQTSILPDGVRLILLLPEDRAIGGRLQRDWLSPTVIP
ncbi:MAG: gspJ [Ramlibacter sp.]|jgi:general secretion pathway protein J|nr:gspJ [Ramlibacter sp.]